MIRIFNEINRTALFYNMGNEEKISFGEVDLGWADWMLLSSGQKEYQSICTEEKLGRLLVTCGDKREQKT